ncbi:signal peptidase II [Arcticibacter sp. MXS-1]|uniref:signal peptidase II n=1 Tax=Arcticibacter sp. MXS-1 TaxID=3341726 RepID=UPI0035A88D44
MVPKRRRIIAFCLLSILLIAVDQYTKALAREYLMYEAPRSYLNDMFRLLYIENTGAFFGMGADIPQPFNFILLSLLPLIMLGALLFYALKKADVLRTSEQIAFAMIFSGGLGNIIDRIAFSSRVTDFLNVGIGSIRTGIFNVADMYVTTGVLLLLVLSRDWDKKS